MPPFPASRQKTFDFPVTSSCLYWREETMNQTHVWRVFPLLRTNNWFQVEELKSRFLHCSVFLGLLKDDFSAKKKILGLTNYIDHATATCRRSQCHLAAGFVENVGASTSHKLKVGCLHPVACTRSGWGFPSNATLVWIFYLVTTTCFGLMTIFRRKDGHKTETCSGY
jgi:hypothetical protein